MPSQYPMREQRKLASRAALVQAAIELFEQQGLEETTLEDIAARAGLHVQTLYRHFANKRDLVTAVDQHFLERFQAACAKRSGDTLQFWRQWVGRAAKNIMAHGASYRRGLHTLYAVPNFPTPYLHIWHEYERTLAAGVAKDMNVDLVQNRLPILIACMLWGGTSHVFWAWLTAGGKADLQAETLAMIDTVIAQYQHLLGKQSN